MLEWLYVNISLTSFKLLIYFFMVCVCVCLLYAYIWRSYAFLLLVFIHFGAYRSKMYSTVYTLFGEFHLFSIIFIFWSGGISNRVLAYIQTCYTHTVMIIISLDVHPVCLPFFPHFTKNQQNIWIKKNVFVRRSTYSFCIFANIIIHKHSARMFSFVSYIQR